MPTMEPPMVVSLVGTLKQKVWDVNECNIVSFIVALYLLSDMAIEGFDGLANTLPPPATDCDHRLSLLFRLCPFVIDVRDVGCPSIVPFVHQVRPHSLIFPCLLQLQNQRRTKQFITGALGATQSTLSLDRDNCVDSLGSWK